MHVDPRWLAGVMVFGAVAAVLGLRWMLIRIGTRTEVVDGGGDSVKVRVPLGSAERREHELCTPRACFDPEAKTGCTRFLREMHRRQPRFPELEGWWWRPQLVMVRPDHEADKTPCVTDLAMPQPGWITYVLDGVTRVFQRVPDEVHLIELQLDGRMVEGEEPWWVNRKL